MSQTVITSAFEQLKAQEAANGGVVILDEFVFANVPGLDISDPIDRGEGMPDTAMIVHRQPVGKTGMVNNNAVVYSVVMGADVGDFEFNWVGLVNKANGVVAMIVHAPTQKKLKTAQGQQGNVLTRSFLMEYNGASEQTQIVTPADTWQIDFTARLNGVDERIRRENMDIYGEASFLADGFLVSRAGSQYMVKKGIGYVAGVRAELLFDQNISINQKPVKIWVDVAWKGTLTSTWASAVKLTVAEHLENYADRDEQHYVCAIAEIAADGSVNDLRNRDTAGDGGLSAAVIGSESGYPVQEYLFNPPVDFYIGAFFNTNENTTTTLISSPDGFCFNRVNFDPMVSTNQAPVGSRDPSIAFYKNRWYIAHTSVLNGAGGWGSDITIMVSDDLLTWTPTGVNLYGSQPLKGQPGSVLGGIADPITTVWAPCLFVDNGHLYVAATCNANGKIYDKNGTLVNYMLPFICRCTDVAQLAFDTPTVMFTDNTDTHIDVEMTKKDGVYYATIKNEYSKNIEIWSSENIRTGYQLLSTVDFGGIPVEGSSLVWSNGRRTWRLYADAFGVNGTYYYIESDNLAAWDLPVRVRANFDLRHGTVINLANVENPVRAVSSFVAASSMYKNNTQYNIPIAQPSLTENKTVVPIEGAVYRVTGSNSVTLTINEKGGEYFYGYVSSRVSTANMTVTGAAIDGTHNLGQGLGNLAIFKFSWNQTTKLYAISAVTGERLLSRSNEWEAIQIYRSALQVDQYLDVGSANLTPGSRRLGLFNAGNKFVSAGLTQTQDGALTLDNFASAANIAIYKNGNIGINPGAQKYVSIDGHTYPQSAGLTLGRPANPWTGIYSENAISVVSDGRHKPVQEDIPDKILDIWETIRVRRFKYDWSIAEKGVDKARWHTGWIVQDIIDAFSAAGEDAMEWALVVYNEWPAQPEIVESWEDEYLDTPAEFDENGEIVVEAQRTLVRAAGSRIIQPAVEAGNQWRLVMDECSAIEAACQHRRLSRIEQKLKA